ncbi:MAG: radical SAM protein [Elusimicrobiota bacterium]|jgi:hypothetical protein|nr:radical SAM protein [Elusimicrobiota bacterium]
MENKSKALVGGGGSLRKFATKFFEAIFHCKNDGIYKVVNVFGLRFKIKNKYKEVLLKLRQQEQKLEKSNKDLNEKLKRITPRPIFKQIDIPIVDHCNLNCKGCNYFSTLAQERFMPFEIFKKDLERMAQLTNGNIEQIKLLGGEPLLHTDLLKFIDCAGMLFKNTKLIIVTNAILLKQQNDDFWQCLKENAVELAITKYPINLDWEYIDAQIGKFDIESKFWGRLYNELGRKTTHHYTLALKGNLDPAANFIKCEFANLCIALRDGKLATCQMPISVQHFNKHFNCNIEITEKDYIDIYKAKNLEEICQFLANPIPMCRYCNVAKRTYNNDWGLSKKEISEWT